jgi:DNA-binding XRE family transcriptional regulator
MPMSDPLFLVAPETDKRELAAFAGSVLRNVDAVRRAYSEHRSARWVLVDASALALFADSVEVHNTWHRVLFLERARAARRELLHALFRVVVAPDEGVRLLPNAELKEVMGDEHAADLIIGGVVDPDDRRLIVYRGNLDRLVIPFDWFRSSAKGPRPDFNAFSVIDSGQTIRLGDYEAATDAVLYDFDSEARRRMRQKEIGADGTFGGSLRRLRLQKGLSRSDFAPISAKTIARIERGEVEEPHDETLATIAKRLGVKADDIKSF